MSEAIALRSARFVLALGTVACVAFASTEASTQAADSFFRDKQISLIVGYPPGGGYDIYARLAANFLSRHIPGNPTIVPKNMPGISSLKAANFIYEQAARDGTVLGMVSQSLAFEQAIKNSAVQFDARHFSWIGRMAPVYQFIVAWNTSGVNSIEDAMRRDLIIAADSPRGVTATAPRLLNRMAGTKFKIISAYPGTANGLLALERGEVQSATAPLEVLTITKSEWVSAKKVSILVGYSMGRTKEFPNVPGMGELGQDADRKKILQLYASTADLGRSILAPPGVPKEQLATLRAAFDAMTKSPEFLADVAKRKLDLEPMPGQQVADMIQQALSIAPQLAEQAATAAEP